MDWTLLAVLVVMALFFGFFVWVFSGEAPDDEVNEDASEFEPDYSLFEGDE